MHTTNGNLDRNPEYLGDVTVGKCFKIGNSCRGFFEVWSIRARASQLYFSTRI